MLDQHVPHAQLHPAGVQGVGGRQLPVRAQVERELGQQSRDSNHTFTKEDLEKEDKESKVEGLNRFFNR